MSNAEDDVRGAVLALARVRRDLRGSLEAETAWRALMQLDDRERQGDALSAIDRGALRERLARDLDGRVTGWRLLSAVEAALAALAEQGVDVDIDDGHAAQHPASRRSIDTQSTIADSEIDVVLSRIRSIADGIPDLPAPVARTQSLQPSAEGPAREPQPALPPRRMEPASSSHPVVDVVPRPRSRPIARMDRIESELDGLLASARRPGLHAIETPSPSPAPQAQSQVQDWSGSRSSIVEEAEIEIVLLPDPIPSPGPAAASPPVANAPDRATTTKAMRGRQEFDRSHVVDTSEATVEIVQIAPPERR